MRPVNDYRAVTETTSELPKHDVTGFRRRFDLNRVVQQPLQVKLSAFVLEIILRIMRQLHARDKTGFLPDAREQGQAINSRAFYAGVAVIGCSQISLSNSNYTLALFLLAHDAFSCEGIHGKPLKFGKFENLVAQVDSFLSQPG